MKLVLELGGTDVPVTVSAEGDDLHREARGPHVRRRRPGHRKAGVRSRFSVGNAVGGSLGAWPMAAVQVSVLGRDVRGRGRGCAQGGAPEAEERGGRGSEELVIAPMPAPWSRSTPEIGSAVRRRRGAGDRGGHEDAQRVRTPHGGSCARSWSSPGQTVRSRVRLCADPRREGAMIRKIGSLGRRG